MDILEGKVESLGARPDLAALRTELHAAVDAIVDRFSPASAEVDPVIVAGAPLRGWEFRWPDGTVERIEAGREYQLRSGERTVEARLGWTTRRAWGRDRRRWIVFLAVARRGAGSFYPVAEFVETDHGEAAASIPDPARPRALLTAGRQTPARFAGATVRRADEVFGRIRRGPSLRLVVAPDDASSMLQHGYWVASTRGRLP